MNTLRAVSTRLRILKRVPLLPQLFDTLLLAWGLAFTRERARAFFFS